MLAFIAAYVWAAVMVSDYVPNQWAIRLAYYAVVGIGWGFPLFPLFRWMNREP